MILKQIFQVLDIVVKIIEYVTCSINKYDKKSECRFIISFSNTEFNTEILNTDLYDTACVKHEECFCPNL